MKVSFGTVAVIKFDTANEYLVFDKDKKPCGWVLELIAKKPVSSTILNDIIKNNSVIDIEYNDGSVFVFNDYSVVAIETMFSDKDTPITILKFTKGVKKENDIT